MQSYTNEELIELTSWVFKTDPIDVPDVASGGRADFRRVDQLILTSVELPPLRMEHDPDRLRGIDNDYLLFEVVLKGQKRGATGNTYVEQGVGNIHLIDMSQRYIRVHMENVQGYGILIPHEAVGFDPSRHPRFWSRPITSDSAQVLLPSAKALYKQTFEPINLETTCLYAAAFVSLVRTLILREASVDSALERESGLNVLRSLIRNNLANPELSPKYLANRLGVSRAALYRMFRDEGGLSQYIAEQRLHSAFADLAGMPAEWGAVRRVAERWGFSDQGTFNRRFRERFGMTPSDCLMSRRVDLPVTGPTKVWHPVFDWVAKQPASATKAS